MTIIDDLKKALGDDAVLTGDAISSRYRSDASRTGKYKPLALLRPASTDEVAATELAVMRRIKEALDPNGILNPGKVLGS